MKICTRIVLAGIVSYLSSVHADPAEIVELNGANYACTNSQQMNLWDISGDSPLIRDDMLRKDWCWKTPDGLHVRLIERIGKFARVSHLSNGIEFYVYGGDLRKRGAPKIAQKDVKTVERQGLRLLSVSNTHKYGVTLIRGAPTVIVSADAGGGLNVEFTIRKDKLAAGLQESISNQRGAIMQFGGKCGGWGMGLGGLDDFTLKIVAMDAVSKVAEFELSGIWHKCNRDNDATYRLLPSKLRVTGKQFEELVRPHTPKELMRTIS